MSLAKSIVNDCLRINEKDNVTLNLYPHNLSLAEEIADECFKNGADVIMSLYTDKFYSSYYRNLSEESLKKPSAFCRALTQSSTVEIFLANPYDPKILRTIDSAKLAADALGENGAHFPLNKERKIRTLNVGLASVTKPRAKAYGFKYKKWSKMMDSATSVDYKKLSKKGRTLRDSLNNAKAIAVTGPGKTNLSFEVSGRKWYMSDGIVDDEDIKNEDFNDQLPAGSVTIAPLEDTAEGRITFNAGTPLMGRLVDGLQLTFKDGKVTDFKGNNSTLALEKNFEEGTGNKDSIGMFNIGFNPAAETGFLVNNVAYGAVSIGIGGNEFIGGTNKPGFFHFDTIVGASVKADGRAIIQKGKIVV